LENASILAIAAFRCDGNTSMTLGDL
jgi:hypothetical protein